jgi:hypothetical protein
MSAEYVSLATLAQRMDIYEDMPMPLQRGLQNSVRYTLIANVACILLLTISSSFGYVEPGSFFGVIEPTAEAANMLIGWIYGLSGVLSVLNVASLLLTLFVLLVSSGMTKPVQEPVHWLAWGAAIPSGMSAVSVATLTVLFVLLAVVTLLIWIVLICMIVVAIGIVLSILFA